MNAIAAWVRDHRWESVSGVLAVALVVALVSLVSSPGGPVEEDAVAATTTTTPTVTSDSPDTTDPGGSEEEPAPTTEPPSDEVTPSATAVVVDNHPDARLQIGIDAADLIVETPVEGGLTRFTALYGGQPPDLVGPVRSLRPVSADLLAPFQPVVFTTGGQPFVTGAVSGAGANIVMPEDSVAFQSLERPQPHHLFVSPSVDVSEGVEFPAPWEVGEWPGGEPAGEVTLPISGGVTWRYENDVYVRYQDGEPFLVQSSFEAEPEALTRATVIVLVANQKSAGYTDSTGADVPTFDVVGGGDLYVLHGGELIEGSWFRASQVEGYVFTGDAGQAIPIPPGGLYLAIVPDTLAVDAS